MTDKSFMVKAFTKWVEAKENITGAPYLKGQNFEGWSLNENGVFIDDQHEFVEDTNIYPVYQTSYVQINLNLGNGLSDTKYIRVQRDSTYEQNKDLFNIDIEYIGYKLKYWSLSENGDAISTDYVFTTNINVYAVYEVKNITLSLHSISKLPFESLQVQQGTYFKDIKQQLELTLTDYIFHGWSLNENGDPLINDNYQFLDDTHIYAYFTYDTSITIKFYTDDNNFIEIKANEGDVLNDILDTFDKPQREGWILYGWSTVKNDYNNLVDNDLYLVDDDTSLYAIWAFNVTINFNNKYPELIESNGIIGTFVCCEGETVQDLLNALMQSNNYKKLTSIGSFNFNNDIYKDNILLDVDHILQPQDNNLNVSVESNKVVYVINQLYIDGEIASDNIQFEFDSITTINNLYNEFKKYAQDGYDLYGDVIGFDYNNSTNDVESYDDGLYLNFNTLNNINIDFSSCNLTNLTLAIKQTTPLTFKRGWRYPNAVQINGIMSPYTSFIDNDLLTKIKNLCSTGSTVTNGNLVWIDENQYIFEDSDTYQDIDDVTGESSTYYNFISLIPSDNENYYISESFLYNKTIYFNHWNNLQFIFNLDIVNGEEKLLEFIYMKNDTGRYKSIPLVATYEDTKNISIGINIFNNNENVKIYAHNNNINGIEKLAAVIVHKTVTGEVEKIIQLNNLKIGDVFGVNQNDVSISDKLIEASNLQMPIASENKL